MNRDKSETALFSIMIAILLAVIFLFFTAFLLREQDHRKLVAEYSAYRNMSALFEDFVSDEPSAGIPRDARVLGFGVYQRDGKAVRTMGTAPDRIPNGSLKSDRPEIAYGRGSIRIMKPLGAAGGIPGMGPGMMGPPPASRLLDSSGAPIGLPGAMNGAGRFLMPGIPPRSGPNALPEHFMFIEYLAPDLVGRSSFDLTLIVSVFLALSIVFFLTLNLFRKNRAYRNKEVENAQLIELGQAARTLAHEIKNPLGVISIQCASLKRTVPEERWRGIDVIVEEVSRMVMLTDRVGEYLRNSIGSPEAMDLRAFLEEFAVRYDGRVRFSGGESPFRIKIDRDRFRSVMQNLVQNAFESQEGRSMEPVEIEMETGRGGVSVIVRDRGCGVPPESVSRIFSPFFTTKPKGSGIGLAMSRQFMRRVGGDVSFRQRQGGGSEFIVAFPPEAR
jgi:two-component system, NtrC family, sensor histidine kinase HydH